MFIYTTGNCGSDDGDTSYELLCSGSQIIYRNYTSSDCSGSVNTEISDLCNGLYDVGMDCIEICGLGQCKVAKVTDYHNITGCDGDSPSGYDFMTVYVNGIIDHCDFAIGDGFQWGFQTLANSTHIWDMRYSSTDCSGDGYSNGIYVIGSYCDADSGVAYIAEVTSTAAIQYHIIMAVIVSIFALISN